MASLWDVYEQLTEQDDQLEKQAALEAVEEFVGEQQGEPDEDLLKMAAEYDAAGRIMARSFMEEMMKSAQAEMADEEKEEKEEKKEEKKEGKGEEKEEGKKEGKKLPPWLAEKKAHYLQAMKEDPEYAQQLIAYFSETE